MKLFALACVALLVDHAPARACATAPPAGAEARIADEEAVIVWDPATSTETFIRRAQFQATTKSFGFLVPTPAKPELGEAPAGLFSELADAIRPEITYKTSGTTIEPGFWCFPMMGGAKSGAPERAPAVRVIQSAHVAGFDAVTVEADAPQALADWLGAHGFEATPQLTAWLEPYVAKHWTITAFVVASEQKDGQHFELATRAVKMTFHADAPFYPYREPDPPKQSALDLPPRMLRVFFVSDKRYTGRLGDAAWNASTLWSAPLDATKLLGTPLPRTTVFIDEASPRLAHDEVIFVPNKDQAEVKQPPIVIDTPRHITIPIDGLLVAGVIGVVVLVRRRRR